MTATVDSTAPATEAEGHRADFTMLRVSLFACLVYAALGLVGFAILGGFWPPPAESLGPAAIAHYFREHDAAIKVGMIMMICCGPFYFVWSVVLSRIITRIEGPMGPLAMIEMLGGLLTGLVTFFPPVVWLTAAFRIDTRSDATIGMLFDFGWIFFDVTFFCSVLQTVALGIAILRDRRTEPLFPSWVAWLCFLVGACDLPLCVMPLVHSGPFAWNGLFNFWVVFSVFFVQIAVVTPYAYRAIGRIQREMA